MNIVVSMKQIPDLQQIRIRDRKPIFDGVPFTFGTIDKNALEAAVQIKEKIDSRVIMVGVGSSDLEDTAKEALAAGADEARMVIWGDALESSQSAQLIAAAIKQLDSFDLILFGEGSGDNYSSQVGSRVAQILELPQVGYVNHIEIEGDIARVTRSLEDCEQTLEIKLPAVITVTSDINVVRIPSVTQILRAGKKPRESIEAEDLGINISDPLVETISNLAPEMQRKQIVVKTVNELVKVLADEGFGGRA